jgi:hypothetical protein
LTGAYVFACVGLRRYATWHVGTLNNNATRDEETTNSQPLPHPTETPTKNSDRVASSDDDDEDDDTAE